MMTEMKAGVSQLERVGVIDIGSNSVRLVVFDGASRSPAYFYNEKILCGLGRGIGDSGVLHPQGRVRALAAMQRFAALARSFNVQSLQAVATAAVREARDGAAFCEEVKAATGIEIVIASGVEEARLSAQGVLLGWPTADGLVCDIGGASMELAEVSGGVIGRRQTSPLGPLKLESISGGVDGQRAEIARQITALRAEFDGAYETIYLVGGSYRAMAKLDIARSDYPLEVLHEYKMDRAYLNDMLGWINATPLDDLHKLTTTSKERMNLVPTAALVLQELVAQFDPEVAAISSYGLREGLLYERMTEDMRQRDPLIEASLMMEQAAARFPGFGAHLAAWIAPLLPDTVYWSRIVMAASLLHDVSWRSDPSSRAEECFDNASRANMGGLDHPGRVLLAMALLHRYSKHGRIEKYKQLRALLDQKDQDLALVIGRGLRLGAALAGGDARVLAGSKLFVKGTELVLKIGAEFAGFNGEAVGDRLRDLAKALGLNPVLMIAETTPEHAA